MRLEFLSKQVEYYGLVLTVPHWTTHLATSKAGAVHAFNCRPVLDEKHGFWRGYSRHVLNIIVGDTDWRSTAKLAAVPSLAIAAKLLAVSRAVLEIIEDSDGVAGYHLNGNIATWDELDLLKVLHAEPADCVKEHNKLLLQSFVDWLNANNAHKQLDCATTLFLEDRDETL